MEIFTSPCRTELVLSAPIGRRIRIVKGKLGKQWIEQSKDGKKWNRDFSDWFQESFSFNEGSIHLSEVS